MVSVSPRANTAPALFKAALLVTVQPVMIVAPKNEAMAPAAFVALLPSNCTCGGR
jgi:hypothetical protein